MKKVLERLKQFFFPPAEMPMAVRAAPYFFLGAMTLVLLVSGAYAWDYTNSPGFCGTSCHTMPPQYSAYVVSPHARIDCVDCHIGKGFIATRVTRKAGDLKHVFATLFSTYEYPIRAKSLRPARETCELCHSPQKFSDDSLREIRRFANDPANTPQSTYLVMKTGGGSEREGLGRGIHWHIQNKVYYLAEDEEEQVIPYIKTVDEAGNIEEFIDIEADFDPSSVDPAEVKEMDCITCHNRITHKVMTPEDTVDQLIARGQISTLIPEIRNKAVQVYSQRYDTLAMGVVGISGLSGYYQHYYPDFYQQNQALVDEAIAQLQAIYQESVYPEQKSDWSSHPNNVGHKDSPGCFRCHDGKHLNTADEAIRLECNLCHSIPVVAGPNDFVADIEVSRGPEPESHLNENWISLHNQAFNETCSLCHSTEDAGGTSNTSFCSNSACHGSVWTYAGFDAPRLRATLIGQIPPTPTPAPFIEGPVTYTRVIAPILETNCAACHGQDGMKGLNLTTYAGLMAGGDSGPVVNPGDPEGSLIVQKQAAEPPHFARLSSQDLELLVEWISAGAPASGAPE